GHMCRRGSTCKAVIDGLHCLTAGSAGPGLVWVGCGRTKHIYKPRAFFSVDHPGPASAEGPDAPALPS
ncbi:MAG: hypothetical protein M3Z33_13075, partial [Actinomycetota bacterium]|nr:hypothetical protein [Actinomycetota bacterium]